MKGSRYIRSASVLASAALILGAFVAPADAKKKKKPKTPPPPPACAPYTPGEQGAEAPTLVVTDAATAEAPAVVDLTAEAGLPSLTVQGQQVGEKTALYHNIQVDTANPTAGLYLKIEFSDRHDYDLNLNYADGATAASSGDSNPSPGHGAGSPEGAWEGGTNYESVLGINTPDCAGYTAEIVSFLATGGAVKVSAWLGEVRAEPDAPAK